MRVTFLAKRTLYIIGVIGLASLDQSRERAIIEISLSIFGWID